jgi:hypothetical protein
VHIVSTFRFIAQNCHQVKKGKFCSAFTGQTTCGISTKLYRSDQYHPKLCTSAAPSALLHKMTTRAKNRKIVSSFTGQTTGGFKPNFRRVISTILSCARQRHIPLRCKNWPPELNKKLSQVVLLDGFQ